MRCIQLTLIIVAVVFASTGFAETRIFDLHHRRAAEVAEVVRSVLGDEAKVTAIGHSLVVNARPRELSAVEELVTRFDRPARMVRVFVAQDQRGSSTTGTISSSVSVVGGDAAVIAGGGRPTAHPPTFGGATVILGGDHGMIVGSGHSSSRMETHLSQQFLTTLEGSPARISVGRRIPFAERWLTLARRHARIVENIRYESVDTGFEVIPTVLADDQVELVVHPFMAFFDRHGGREIQFSELTTTVRIRLGDWFDLGESMAARDEISSEILGVGSWRSEESENIRVRVELQPE